MVNILQYVYNTATIFVLQSLASYIGKVWDKNNLFFSLLGNDGFIAWFHPAEIPHYPSPDSLIHGNFLPAIHLKIQQKHFLLHALTSLPKLNYRKEIIRHQVKLPRDQDFNNRCMQPFYQKQNWRKCLFSCLIILQSLPQCWNWLNIRQPMKPRFRSALGKKICISRNN